MALFDAYVAVDWSASGKPKTGKDSIWCAFRSTDAAEIVNVRTREEATLHICAALRTYVQQGRRVLVGFDFAYGYPRGFADRVAPGAGPAWRRVWDALAGLVVDDESNANTRLEAALALNSRLGDEVFWGAGHAQISATHPRSTALPEHRAVERVLHAHGSRPQSVWKLSYAGSVGSQVLLGIPRLRELRDDAQLAAVSRVWPFETGFEAPRDAQVVHAEIYPTLGARGEALHEVADAHQVLATVALWAELDEASQLAPLFEPPAGLGDEDLDAALREEGWILGAPQLVRRRPRAARQRPRADNHGLVFAAIAPHGGPVFDLPESPTRKAMEELGRRFDAARPEAAIVITPHGLHVDGQLSVVRSKRLEGDASQWTDADTHLAIDGEPALADACIRALRDDGLPAAGISFGTTYADASTMPLDWGALIPLWFMRAPAVVVTPSRDLSNDELVRAGAALARATRGRRVALIASADHGHGHTHDGPYGFAPESEPYDTQIVELVRENRLGEILDVDPEFARAARADSYWQLVILHGALGDRFDAELLSYEVPTYFGMLCAAFSPRS